MNLRSAFVYTSWMGTGSLMMYLRITSKCKREHTVTLHLSFEEQTQSKRGVKWVSLTLTEKTLVWVCVRYTNKGPLKPHHKFTCQIRLLHHKSSNINQSRQGCVSFHFLSWVQQKQGLFPGISFEDPWLGQTNKDLFLILVKNLKFPQKNSQKHQPEPEKMFV